MINNCLKECYFRVILIGSLEDIHMINLKHVFLNSISYISPIIIIVHIFSDNNIVINNSLMNKEQNINNVLKEKDIHILVHILLHIDLPYNLYQSNRFWIICNCTLIVYGVI